MATKHKPEKKEEKKPESTRPVTFMPDPADSKKMVQVGPQKVDTEGYSGSYHKLDEPKNAEPYKLKVIDAEEATEHYGRTHHLINQEHSWAGTEEEFKKAFEKT